jgi:hypothetical protein
MTKRIHHFCSDYEGKIEEIDGKLKYSLVVESSFVSLAFSFDIENRDFDVLKKDQYRNAALFHLMHTLLQSTLGPDLAATGKKPTNFSQEQFRFIASRLLFSSELELKQFIDEFSVRHNIKLEKYIGKQIGM